MKIATKALGEVEINEDEIITIVEGIFGFPELTRYVMLMKEEEAPFAWLQSVEDSELAFVIIDPNLFKYNYRLDVNEEFLKKVGAETCSDVLSYSIVVIPAGDSTQMTANLQGPVIINPKNKLGTQAISEVKNYTVRHFIMQELKEKQDKEAN